MSGKRRCGDDRESTQSSEAMGNDNGVIKFYLVYIELLLLLFFLWASVHAWEMLGGEREVFKVIRHREYNKAIAVS